MPQTKRLKEGNVVLTLRVPVSVLKEIDELRKDGPQKLERSYMIRKLLYTGIKALQGEVEGKGQ